MRSREKNILRVYNDLISDILRIVEIPSNVRPRTNMKRYIHMEETRVYLDKVKWKYVVVVKTYFNKVFVHLTNISKM